MALRLICAIPNPGCPGTPRGLFFRNTPDGERLAAEFAKREDRPGWGIFETPNSFRDDAGTLETFGALLEDYRASREGSR
jgi:hypothetical protein